MLTRFQKRQETATRLASAILADYGNDIDSASDRVLALCNGQRWLERLVLKEMHQQVNRSRRKAA